MKASWWIPSFSEKIMMIGKKYKKPKRFFRVKGAKNIYFCVQTDIYYLNQQINRKRIFLSTGVKGEGEIIEEADGWYVKAIKGLGAAKTAVHELRNSKKGPRRNRPTFAHFSDLTMEIQKTKAPRTYVVAKDGDKNLRPFFEKECPYLDSFMKNYEQVWARYKTHMAKEKPGRKLAHDRKYLIMVLRRAKKQKAISEDFVKGDFPLNEVTEPVGIYLEDWQIKRLLEAAMDLGEEGNIKIYQQIMLSAHLGLRKSEILKLNIAEVNLRTREIDLNAERLKIRKRRGMRIPIQDDVYPILKELVKAAQGPFLFPRIYTNRKGRPVDWENPQTDNNDVFERVKMKAKIDCRFHDLRHTAITNMIASGIPLPTVSDVMGATPETCTKVYNHLNKKTKDDLRGLGKGRYELEKKDPEDPEEPEN